MVHIGVDGCKEGWVVARDDGTVTVRVVRALAEALEPGIVVVDIPYGLVDEPERKAVLAARRFLAKFKKNSSVFPSPGLAVLHLDDYAEANALSKTRYDKGLTKQTFELRHKIREAEALATDPRLYEGHPEVSFAVMGGVQLPPKRTPEGQAKRRALLRHHLGVTDFQVPVGAATDDLLDALALLWSARRVAQGQARTFPAPPPTLPARPKRTIFL